MESRKILAEVFGPPPKLLIYGAVDTAEALCALARPLGWRTIVADARATFLTSDRIPSADERIVGWPDEVLEQVQPDYTTAIVVLTHDDKFDVPLLQAALTTDALYIGALGSRRNQARRRERLIEEGVDEEALARIHGPAGLDLGADTQAETALSILAEIVAVRAGRSGGPLRRSASSESRRGGVMAEAGKPSRGHHFGERRMVPGSSLAPGALASFGSRAPHRRATQIDQVLRLARAIWNGSIGHSSSSRSEKRGEATDRAARPSAP